MSFDSEDIEQRLSTVEAALSEVKQKLGMAPAGANWVEGVSGSFSDIPDEDYQKFLECCRAVRNGEAISEAEEPKP